MDHHHGPKRKIQNIQVEENPQISEISSGDRRKRQLPKSKLNPNLREPNKTQVKTKQTNKQKQKGVEVHLRKSLRKSLEMTKNQNLNR